MLDQRSVDIRKIRSAHLVGIGGAAMTPLATILLQRGVRVTGSDLELVGAGLTQLRKLGAEILSGHSAAHVGDVDVVIVSSAIPAGNEETSAALQRGIPLMKHSVALGSLMQGSRTIAIAGTHGKTTTSALTAWVLDTIGQNPSFHVGSELVNYGLFGRSGSSDLFVVEADEYDRRFLDYQPEIALVTSVEPDHLDYYGTMDAVVEAFEEFLGHVPAHGAVILCADDPVASHLPVAAARRITYGFHRSATWAITNWSPAGARRSSFTVRGPDEATYHVETGLIGKHNAANACGVIAIAASLSLPIPGVIDALASFRGTRRRFETVAEIGGVTIVDDYAHHPTAIRATLEAAREHYNSAIWAVFQPHTAHRTTSLFDEFAAAFTQADHLFLAPTYRPAGREEREVDPTVAHLAANMTHPDVRACSDREAADTIGALCQPGDLILVMGAGDIWMVEERIAQLLHQRWSQP